MVEARATSSLHFWLRRSYELGLPNFKQGALLLVNKFFDDLACHCKVQLYFPTQVLHFWLPMQLIRKGQSEHPMTPLTTTLRSYECIPVQHTTQSCVQHWVLHDFSFQLSMQFQGEVASSSVASLRHCQFESSPNCYCPFYQYAPFLSQMAASEIDTSKMSTAEKVTHIFRQS